jgi:hypothetical protein
MGVGVTAIRDYFVDGVSTSTQKRFNVIIPFRHSFCMSLEADHDELRTWCLEEYGEPGLRWQHDTDYIDFADDNDALRFKMRWG